MPEQETIQRARKDEAEGKSPSTQAGEFVREEMHHIREGKHGAQSPQQAVAIGLSKARRAGVKLPPPKGARTSSRTKRQAERDLRKGRRRGNSTNSKTSRTRSRAILGALKKEGRSAASHRALSNFAHSAASRRGKQNRRSAAQKAVRTKGHAGLQRAARKAARTRSSR